MWWWTSIGPRLASESTRGNAARIGVEERKAPAPSAATDRHFFAAGERLGENEIGHVGARDEQHEGDGAEKNEQSGADVADHLFVKRNCGGAPAFVVCGILLLEAGGYGGEVGFGLVDCDLRLEARDDLVIVIAADGAVCVSPAEWDPGPSEIGHAEISRHHADDGIALGVHGDVAADDSGI